MKKHLVVQRFVHNQASGIFAKYPTRSLEMKRSGVIVSFSRLEVAEGQNQQYNMSIREEKVGKKTSPENKMESLYQKIKEPSLSKSHFLGDSSSNFKHEEDSMIRTMINNCGYTIQKSPTLLSSKIHRKSNTQEPIAVYTDGSFLQGCKRKISSAGIGVYYPHYPELNLSKLVPVNLACTSHRTELIAVIHAITIARSQFFSKVNLFCDCLSVVNFINKWNTSWDQSKWESKSKDKDLEAELVALLRQVDVECIHVRAHSGVMGNVHADKLARRAAKMTTTRNMPSD